VKIVFKKLSIEEMLRLERDRISQIQNDKVEKEEIIFNQLVDLDFRQSLIELGVDVNDL
jgi:hypothetical protein